VVALSSLIELAVAMPLAATPVDLPKHLKLAAIQRLAKQKPSAFLPARLSLAT
jgi:hypothetical protein